MKKLLLLSGAAALCAFTMTAGTPAARYVKIGKKPVPETLAKARKAVAAAAQPELWRAKTSDYYSWDIKDFETMTGRWVLIGSYEYTYNNAGQVLTEDRIFEKYEYEYDSEGRCIRQTEYADNDSTFVPYSKIEYTYDDVVRNLVTQEAWYNYDNATWTLMGGSRTNITRNADNNITRIVEQSYSSYDETPGWTDDNLTEIGYGDDKKANSIKVYEYEDGVPGINLELVDIVWERTDGQIVTLEMDEEEFFLGPNRISTAKAVAASTYPYAGDIYYSVTYKPEDGGYNMTATMNGATYMSQDYTVLDAYGSYTSEIFEIDYDGMDDGTYVPDGPMLDVYTKIYDAYGLTVKDSEISYTDGSKENGIDYQSETTGDITYDATHGYPLEYIIRDSYDGKAPVDRERWVYSDYYDIIAAGVTDVEAAENAPVEYYNLQGVRVANPDAGLYIRRQGNKVSKVIIR